jgi:hypothetical protein
MCFPATLLLVQKGTKKYISDGVLQKAYDVQTWKNMKNQWVIQGKLHCLLLGEIETLH